MLLDWNEPLHSLPVKNFACINIALRICRHLVTAPENSFTLDYLHNLERLAVDDIDFLALKAAGLVPGVAKSAKVIKTGKLERAVKLSGLATTKGARAAIEAAGGGIAVEPGKAATGG